jgi:hypothetical protein
VGLNSLKNLNLTNVYHNNNKIKEKKKKNNNNKVKSKPFELAGKNFKSKISNQEVQIKNCISTNLKLQNLVFLSKI